MKIDMHCHVKEGSVDSKVGLEEYIVKLKACGFDGMLITDHDTYKGYRYWKKNIKDKSHRDFVVLKGIEYDTCDAGHILCIMPQEVKMRILELRGLPVSMLIDIVHRHGGILGPAHPCGEKYLSFATTKRYLNDPKIAERFDFFEVFNACESEASNAGAGELAAQYGKVGIGGSDAHRPDCIGTGYTILPEKVTCETELISLIREKAAFQTGGTLYEKTTKNKMGRANKILVYSFWIYNKMGEIVKRRKRKQKGKIENSLNAIDPIEIPLLENQKNKKAE